MPSDVPIDSVRKREEWAPGRSAIDRLPLTPSCPENRGGNRQSGQNPTPRRHATFAILLADRVIATCHGQALVNETERVVQPGCSDDSQNV
jgi:hypothetical protein